MLKIIQRRMSAKIVIALIFVLAIIMAVSSYLIVQRRAQALEKELLVKASSMAMVGAKGLEGYLESFLEMDRLSKEELFDTNYRKIESGPLANAEPPKFSTDYDQLFDVTILPFEDTFVEKDSMVVFAVLVDVNGYLPTHNTRYSHPLTGDKEKDIVGNRTKRVFDDPVGLKAARYDNEDGNGYLLQIYQRDTGEKMWDVSAPVYVRGEHWGAFRIGFSMQQTELAISALRNDIALTMLAMLLIAALTIYLVVSRFTRPLKRLTVIADKFAAGQFGETIEISSLDEVGQLSRSFNQMTQVIVKNLEGEIEKSNRLFERVKEAIQQLSSGANEMMAISTQQASGATEQSSAVQQATTTSEEIAITAKQVAENALRVEALAEQTSSVSLNGTVATENAIDGMNQLKNQVQAIATAMLQLGENSQKIGGIVDIIDEISDQTNLLSLNAAIEAAGAGEAGKRFSIVANEVKRLAERTADATTQIKGLIEQIQKATNVTIMLTEDGTKDVDRASNLVTNVAEELARITQMVHDTASAASEIKMSTQQQTTACEQMAETIFEVRDVATQVATGAQETERATNELLQLAESLRDLMETDIQDKGKVAAAGGAKVMQRILEQAIDAGRFRIEDLFDENYQPIPNTDPQKYHTCYDTFLDKTIQDIEDAYLKDDHVVYAVLVDHNGYLPTHNSKFTQPLTGDRAKDVLANRTKRIFNDPVGIKAAQNEEEILTQVYNRDTGEKMWDISAPVYVKGRHWGGFRIGYSMD